MSNKFSLDKIEVVMKNNESGGHGFFPIGKNDLWHSGIHLNYLENEGVYPILGGELVAYRLNEEEITCSLSNKISDSTYADDVNVREKSKEYLQQTLSSLYSEAKSFTRYHECIEESDKKYLARSSNYILLRHTLPTKQNEQKYFYSLYMHLSPYGKYLIKNDYCIYLTETKIPKQKPQFNNTEISGKFYVRYDMMKNKDVEPFYLNWNILLKNTKPSVWKLNYSNNDILPFSNFELQEPEYFKSTFTENSEGLLVKINKNTVRVKSQHIESKNKQKWSDLKLQLKIKEGSKAYLYSNKADINLSKPGLFTENQDLTFSLNNTSENRTQKIKNFKIDNLADGTKEKKDTRNIFYIGFVPSIYCEEVSGKTQIKKNCYLRYPQSIADNPEDLYKVDIKNKILYFNKSYVQYPMGSIGFDVYFPTGDVVLKAEDNAIVDNSNELVRVSVEKYNIFVYEKDLKKNEDGTYTVNTSLTKPIYIVDNGENFKDLRIYFPKENEEDKTPEYLLNTKDIIFNNGTALLGKSFEGSIGKNGKVFTETADKEKDGIESATYVRLIFKNTDSKFYLYKDAFTDEKNKEKRKSNKVFSNDNKLWQLSLEWNDVKKLKDKELDIKLTAKVFKKEFADIEYFILNPENKWSIKTVAFSDIPKEAVEDKSHLVNIFGMKKNKRLPVSQEINSFDVKNAENHYKSIWEEISKQQDIIKCVCIDYQGDDTVYADEDCFEFRQNLTGIIREKHGQCNDYSEIKNSVLCFVSNSTSSTLLNVFNLDDFTNKKFQSIPLMKDKNFLELQDEKSTYYLYFPDNSLKKENIYIGNEFDDSFSNDNESFIPAKKDTLKTINPNTCLGTAGGFITDKNFIHYSLFTSEEIKKLEISYAMFNENVDYYKLVKGDEAKKDYMIALPSNPVIFKITKELSTSKVSDKFYEVYIDELNFYINENDYQKTNNGDSIKINNKINYPIYFYENKNQISFNEKYSNSSEYKKNTPEPLLKMKENFFKNGQLLFDRNFDNFENKADTDKGFTNWYKVKVGNPDYKFIVKLGDYLKQDGTFNKEPKLNLSDNTYVINAKEKFELQVYSSPDFTKAVKINVNDVKKAITEKTFPLFVRNPIVEEVILNINGKYEKRKFYGFSVNQENFFVDEKTYNKIHRTTLKLEDFFCIHPKAQEKRLACNFKKDFFNLIIDNLGNKNGKLDDSDIKEIFQAKDFYDKNMDPKDDKNVKVYDSALNYIRSACCTIPLEWDKDLYSDDEYQKFWKDHGFLKEEYKVYQDIMAQTDIKQTLNNCSEFKNLDNYIFYNPAYFLGKLNEWGLLEFNPYEKYEIKPPFEMKNNPGFMPIGTCSNSFTQPFNYPYKPQKYCHEGVDIAVPNAAIISGISGKVIVEGDKGNFSYGCFIVIQADGKYDGKYRYYLLAHLDRNRPHKTEDKRNNYVCPNDIVGYVGNTGHCGTSHIPKTEWNKVDYYYEIGTLIDDNHLDYREKGYGAHLHLQMFLTESSPDDFINIDMNFNKLKNAKGKNDGIACKNKNIVNPFDYSETYIRDTKK